MYISADEKGVMLQLHKRQNFYKIIFTIKRKSYSFKVSAPFSTHNDLFCMRREREIERERETEREKNMSFNDAVDC
jgi:hypothetical protein